MIGSIYILHAKDLCQILDSIAKNRLAFVWKAVKVLKSYTANKREVFFFISVTTPPPPHPPTSPGEKVVRTRAMNECVCVCRLYPPTPMGAIIGP